MKFTYYSWPFIILSSISPLAFSAAVDGFTIDNSSRNDVATAYHRYYVASEDYANNHSWSGNVSNCDAGSVSDDFQNDTLRRINYYRAQVGLPADIYFDPAKNTKSQQAALIFSRQNALSHYPATDFPGNPCLSTAGHEAAGAGNISLGSYGPASIDGLIKDSGTNNAAVGHRRWLLFPRAQEMGNGSIPFNNGFNAANCVWVIGNFKSSAPAQAVAWPNQGYVPYMLIPNDATAQPRWSFSYPGANFSAATITMLQGTTPISLVKEPTFNGYGENTVVWRPSGIPSTAPNSDTTYTVTISNISGSPQTEYSYQVIAIDPYQLNEEPVLSGTTAPFIGLDNNYTFTPIPHAENYELSTSTLTDGTWLEGAETTPSPQITDNTNNDLSLITTALSATGGRAFHLTIPSWLESGQNFEINRNIIPSASSQLIFKNRFRWVTQLSYLKAQISTDDGSSWTDLWVRFGDANSSSGSSATWEPNWQTVTVNIPIQYSGRAVRFRFIHDHNGLAYLGSNTSVGCFIDDIEVTHSQESLNPTTTILNTNTFSFNPANDNQQSLMIRANLGGHWFPYGPSLVVNPIPAQSGYNAYVASNYPGLGAADADDDQDGLTNLLEVSIATLNPTSGNMSGLPAIIDTGSTLAFTLSKSGITGVNYAIEGTADLVNGPWTTADLITLIDNSETLTVSYPKANGLPYFMRIRVETNE